MKKIVYVDDEPDILTTFSELVALASAFVFGLLTIDILLKVVRRVRFSSFVAVFACILLIATIMVQ